MVDIEVEMEDGSFRKCNLPRFSGDKGVEGLFYVYDEFNSQAAERLGFSADDYWTYWPDILDPVSRRKWRQSVDRIVAANRTTERFKEEFNRFVTHYSNSASPRNDLLIRYLLSDECRKPRKVSPDDHATRMESLCLYANRLEGLEAELTENRISMIIFNSFPEPWKRDFKIGRGRPENVNRNEIMEYMNLRKTYADADETKHKKRKNDRNDENGLAKKKSSGKNNEKNLCRHHGTHPWNECSLSPHSKNYHMNPRSPFYRGGRTVGRGDSGRGRFGGRGRGSEPSGRGSTPQQHHVHHGGS